MEQGPPTQQYSVQILTPSFQFSGQLEMVGSPLDFLNDANRDALTLRHAYIAPLTPGGPIRGLARAQISVRKQEVVLLSFAEEGLEEKMRLFLRKELLVAYTPIAVLRGVFHLPAEAPLNDFLALMPGAFVPVTRVHLFPLIETPASFPGESDLLIVGRRHIQLYHIA